MKVKEVLYKNATDLGRIPPRAISHELEVAVDMPLSAGTDITLKVLTPMAFNPVTEKWGPLEARGVESFTLTSGAAGTTPATAGTINFAIELEGNTYRTDNLDIDATAADIKAAIEATMPIDAGAVTVTGTSFDTAGNVFDVSIQTGKHITVTPTLVFTAGTAVLASTGTSTNLNGMDTIGAFIWPQDVKQFGEYGAYGSSGTPTYGTSVRGDSCTAVIMMKGQIHFDDIELPEGVPVSELAKAVKRSGLRAKGIEITHLKGAYV